MQNNLFRMMIARKFLKKDTNSKLFLGNSYSGYWIANDLIEKKGTIWGVGLGRDSSFEYQLVQKGYEFIGFEPERDCYEHSIRQFQGTKAVIENYGLWHKSGYFPYTGENISIVNIFNIPTQSNDLLEIRSLWKVAEEKNLSNNQKPRILKMNIEGAEKEILQRLIVEPLEFEVIIFQAEFLFHLGFKRVKEKLKAYWDLKRILQDLQKFNWQVEDISRHQITLINKTTYESRLN